MIFHNLSLNNFFMEFNSWERASFKLNKGFQKLNFFGKFEFFKKTKSDIETSLLRLRIWTA